MPASILIPHKFRRETLASSYVYYGATGGEAQSTLTFGGYGQAVKYPTEYSLSERKLSCEALFIYITRALSSF